MIPGEVTFITGPMFSGKTEELLRIAHRYEIAGKTIKLFKKKGESRYGEGVVVTHNQRTGIAKEISSLKDVLPIIANYRDTKPISAIFIDEAQFIEDITKENLDYITQMSGVDIYMSGLTLDSFQKPFGYVERFLPYVKIVQLESVCNFCGEFNARYTYRETTENTDQVFVGGVKEYKAICTTCLSKEKNNGEKT